MRNDFFSLLGGMFSADLVSNATKRQGSIINRIARVDSDDYDYQLHVPPQIEDTDNLPTIVFLHGIRERGSGGFVPTTGALSQILKQYLKQVPATVLLPQCRPGVFWSDVRMETMVMRAIEQTAEEFRADPKRLYLIGVSMGGYGVWHYAAKYPGKFAAFVAICGGSPLMSGDRFNPIAQKVGKTPAWLFHGAEDRVVPVSESREMVKALKANQGVVKYSEYESVGHNVWLNALGEKQLMPWLLSQSAP
jgi:predicted peptidase